MRKEVLSELYVGFQTAYIDGSVASNIVYRPQFISNNHKEGKKVLSCIEDELLACDHFQISVAFIGVPVEKHGQNSHLRQKGKIAELALGYGGSVGALKSMGAIEMGLAEEELQPLVDS